MIAGMKGEGLARLLYPGVQLHIFIRVDRFVTRARHAESDHSFRVAEFINGANRLLGCVEGEEEQSLDSVVRRENPIDHPPVISTPQPDLHLRLRMHTE